MAEVTATPIAVSYRDEGYLAAGISASATTITVGAIYKYPAGVKTKQGINATAGFAEISLGNRTEIISFGTNSVDGTTKVSTLTDVRRGLSQTGTTISFTAGTGLAWPKGAKFRVIDYISYIHNGAFVDIANTFSANQTISGTNELRFNSSATAVWKDGSGNLSFKDAANGTKTLTQLAAAAGVDEKAKVSSNDTTQGYLNSKLVAGGGIAFTENNDGAAETLSIAVSGATVPLGGTGVVSLTAYAPIFGGTTATGAVQSGTVGTSGQVLTSNGAGALPTMQSAKHYCQIVYISTTNSSTATTSGNTVNFDTHTYSVPANDITSLVGYRCHISGTNTSTSGTFAIGVKLGTTSIAETTAIASPATGDWAAIIDLFGTTTAGAAASVEATVNLTMSTLKTAVGQGAANVATNGGLTLQFYVTSNNVQAPVITHCWIEKISTTAF